MKDKITKKNGFTMAELLIVVAIIAVLVAVAIPIFNKQLEKSREAYDIATMRQAASLAAEYYYAGVVDEPTAIANGLKWWPNNGGDQANAAGIYVPSTGKFLPYGSTEGKVKAYGKGTSTSSGKTYTFNDDPKIYKPDADYTKAVCMVAIYPIGNNKHIDVYWKDTKEPNKGKYVGGLNQNKPNDPAYRIRIYID